MKITSDTLHHQAGILKLWATLIDIKIPVADAAEILSFPGPYGDNHGAFKLVSERIRSGSTISAALEGLGFPSYVPALTEHQASMPPIAPQFLLKSLSTILKRAAILEDAGVPSDESGRILFFDLLAGLWKTGRPTLQLLPIAGAQYPGAEDTAHIIHLIKSGKTLAESLQDIPAKFTHEEHQLIELEEKIGWYGDVLLNLVWTEQYRLLRGYDHGSAWTRNDGIFTLDDYWSHTMLAAMMGAGLPLKGALDAMNKTHGRDADDHFKGVADRIEKGDIMSEAAAASGFPRFIVEMFKAGEKHDNMEYVLQAIADHYRWEIFSAECITARNLFD